MMLMKIPSFGMMMHTAMSFTSTPRRSTYYYDPDEKVDTDATYNVEEYDNIFASYIEAKHQLNKLRTSRGFFPVVAMVQNPSAMAREPSLGASQKPVARAKESPLERAHLRRVRQSLVPKLLLGNRCACAVTSLVTEQKTVQLALLTARSARPTTRKPP